MRFITEIHNLQPASVTPIGSTQLSGEPDIRVDRHIVSRGHRRKSTSVPAATNDSKSLNPPSTDQHDLHAAPPPLSFPEPLRPPRSTRVGPSRRLDFFQRVPNRRTEVASSRPTARSPRAVTNAFSSPSRSSRTTSPAAPSIARVKRVVTPPRYAIAKPPSETDFVVRFVFRFTRRRRHLRPSYRRSTRSDADFCFCSRPQRVPAAPQRFKARKRGEKGGAATGKL